MTEQAAAQPPSQALRQIAAVAAGAATGAATGTANAPSMGLSGLWAQVANSGAVVFVCIMFYFQMASSAQMARDDRLVFREAVQSLRADFKDDGNRQWQAIREVADSNRKIAEALERMGRAK